jgi:hypothetical protein
VDPKAMKIVGVICLVVCCVLLYVAYERYQTNANNVRAMNQMRQSMPAGPLSGQVEMRPAAPAATKYALLFAVLCGAGGVTCLVIGAKQSSSEVPTKEQSIQ